MNIHDAVINKLLYEFQHTLIDDIPEDDTSRAGIVIPGHSQGDPDPDIARISVQIHENDPDTIVNIQGASSMSGGWIDEVTEVECGGAVTWNRRFTVKARCLLVNTLEDRTQTRSIASTVRSRIEQTLLNIRWSDVHDDDTTEYVSRGVIAESLKGEMVQAGGPPDAYDYHIKVRFEIQTTTTGVTP